MITLRTLKRILVSIVGFTVLALGLALVVLPGPAIVVIPVGLGILACEFSWARRWLRKARELAQQNTPYNRLRQTKQRLLAIGAKLMESITGLLVTIAIVFAVFVGLVLFAIPILVSLLFAVLGGVRDSLGATWKRARTGVRTA